MWLIVIALAASALLIWLLATLRGYERESASTALQQVNELRVEMEALKTRIQTLEVIAAKDESTFSKSVLDEEKPASDDVGPVPSRRVRD